MSIPSGRLLPAPQRALPSGTDSDVRQGLVERTEEMKFGAIQGRSSLIEGGHCLDVNAASGGEFSDQPMDALNRWPSFREWATKQNPLGGSTFDEDELTCPVPAPSQIFAIGLNYRDHATESSMEVPERPMVFTKFASSLSGPRDDIPLVPGSCDWEVELVAVLGRTIRNVDEDEAIQAIAGLTIGQDISERDLQLDGANPQFNLGKSHKGFAPLGPYIVSLDEFSNPWDLEISCTRNGETVQEARTSLLLNGVPKLISYLSRTCELRAGDLVFTGTPSGVGLGRRPPEYLKAGDVLVSRISGIGHMKNLCI